MKECDIILNIIALLEVRDLADKLKILITDDSKLLRKKLRAELEKLDCEVLEAENGKEAIMKDLKEQPDGVILDIVMPEVGGTSLPSIKQ